MNTKQAIKIGVIAGLVSAFFPSIPTILRFGYLNEKWFIVYSLIAIGIIALIIAW